MNVRQLEYLDALARERSFRRAAEECSATQPAVSVAIAKLESELGVELVHRHRREAVLTAPGEALVRRAREALAAVRDLTAEAGRFAGTLTGRLRLGVIPTALPAVAEITKVLLAAHPGVHLEVRSLSSDEIVGELASFRIDAGLTYLDNEPLGAVTTIPVYTERYVFLTADPGPGERVRWADLDGAGLCLLTPDMQNRRIVDGALERSGATVAAVVETNSISALISYVRAGWPSIVSDAWIGLYGVPEGMSAVPLAGPTVAHSVGLVTRPTELPQPLVKALVDSLEPDVGDRIAAGRRAPSSF
ncbi:MAG: LysR family transcriptional regulator [Actinobacteria bacterium]|nr:LysR family transcriptional regulator [Actinomycetota bacterium]